MNLTRQCERNCTGCLGPVPLTPELLGIWVHKFFTVPNPVLFFFMDIGNPFAVTRLGRVLYRISLLLQLRDYNSVVQCRRCQERLNEEIPF